MQESKTVVTIVDETIGLAADPVDTGVNILCPIISPNGPTKLTKVSGPTQLKNYFNAGAGITPDSEQSLKYARAVLNKGPVYIKRASRNLLKGGATFGKYPTTFYVDQQNNVIDGQKVKLALNLTEDKDYDAIIKKVEESKMAFIKLSDTVYVATKNFLASDNKVLKSTSDFDVSNVLAIDKSGTLDGKVSIDISGTSYTFNKGAISSGDANDQLKDFLDKISDKQSASEPIGLYGTGIRYFDYEGGNYSLVRDEDYTLTAIAFGNKVSVSYTDEVSDADLIYAKSEFTDADKLYIYTIKSKSEYEDEYKLTNVNFKLRFDSGAEEEVIQVVTDNVDPDSNADYVIEVPKETTYSEFLEYLVEQLNVYTMTDTSGREELIFVNGTTLDSDNPKVTSEEEEIYVTVTNLTKPGIDEFGIVSKFPNAGKPITVNLHTVNDDGTREMTVSYKSVTGDIIISEDITFSLKAGAVDGYGNDIGYMKANRDSELIEIIPIGGISTVANTISMGNEITGDHIGVSALIAALEYIQEYEESPVNFDYILDGGIVNASYSNAIINACKVYQSFYPMSCQTTKVTKANLKSNRGGEGTYRANFIGAVQNEAILDSGIDTFPGSYYYISKRLELSNTVKEFAPLFGITEGDIGIYSPAVIFKKSDREELLDSQIMTLRRSMTTGSYYLNDDLTLQKSDSYLQETSTVLMVNTICHVAMNYAETLKGQFNTQQLRDNVTNTLTSSLNNRLRVGTQNGPNSITVICNEVNNPVSLQNQRKLRIDIYGRFNRSIKDVLIYTHVQPLEE